MKRRIQNLSVEPATNGFIISGNASDENGQNPQPMRMIATSEADVVKHVAEWVASVYSSAKPAPAKTPSTN